jgi:hypothetical protein
MPLPPWLKRVLTNMFMPEEAAFGYMFCEKCRLAADNWRELFRAIAAFRADFEDCCRQSASKCINLRFPKEGGD